MPEQRTKRIACGDVVPGCTFTAEAATEEDLRVANQRAELVRAHLRGETAPQHSSVSERTLRYWTARYRAAEASCGSGYIGLLPQTSSRGNRTSKMSEQAQEMHAHLRKVLAKQYGPIVANNISILYGGSVKAENAKELFSCPDVDGGLVGGASLLANDFVEIIKALD